MTAAPRAVSPSVNGWNAAYLEAEYERFKADPSSVPDDLRAFFQGFDLGVSRTPDGVAPADDAVRLQSAVADLIQAYRELGHLAARLDPFGRPRPRPTPLALEHHGLGAADLDRVVLTGSVKLPDRAPLRDVAEALERTYCGSIGAEIMHVQDVEERRWLLDRFEETRGRLELTRGQRVHILEQLIRAETFERFLHVRYVGEKRFSIEGGESLIPLLDHLMEAATELGVEEFLMGMAHRGRLNVLNTVLGKSYEQIFTEFEDNWDESFVDGGGDVKYHRGYSGERTFRNGRTLRVAMASNPSHLEAVDPVVEGRCRGKQRVRADLERRRVIPVLIHGDAAVIGQGIVPEVLNLSRLEGYTTGGTVHIVVNNMIGFTTTPEHGRSSRYCTDAAKMIDAPVFHVNGEDPEAVVAAAQVAIEYRQRFRKDVFIDMYCYRRYGHNEADEPSFTQPILTALIRNKPSVLKVYAERLLAEGVITEQDMDTIRRRLDEALDRAQAAAKTMPWDPNIDPGSARWQGFGHRYSHEPVETGVPAEMIDEVCAALGRVPEGFNLNPKLRPLLKARAELPRTREISYADAESLAFGTLLLEGTAVRLSGQDVRRGTFSHRHAVLRDAQTAEPFIPLNAMREIGLPGTDTPPLSPGADGRPRQARLGVYDSPLSELAVLGFEYGYSLADPNVLVLWEAQFGDFANGAQVVIDQFISSAEAKWERWSGLTVLLPHGYEGAGPEHSSARPERFLQLCGNDNMQVVFPTTGPQIFHLLRRQVRRNFRKPLIVMTPKSLLRRPTGTLDELTRGRFLEVLDDPAFAGRPAAARKGVKRLILCTGKIYFELADRRDQIRRTDVAIVRVEQLYPLHRNLLAEVMGAYPASVERVWVQEEPRNMGAYLFINDLLRSSFGVGDLLYIGRDTNAAPAVGSKHRHIAEQESILARAVGPAAAPEKPAAKKSPARATA